MYYNPAAELQNRVEECLWRCRREDTPDEVLESAKEGGGAGAVFGYQCIEYWKPDPLHHMIDLEVCPYWVDKEKAIRELQPVWDWCDQQATEMLQHVQRALRKLFDMDVSPKTLVLPPGWEDWIGGRELYGMRCRFDSMTNEVVVRSDKKFGRFASLPFAMESSVFLPCRTIEMEGPKFLSSRIVEVDKPRDRA